MACFSVSEELITELCFSGNEVQVRVFHFLIQMKVNFKDYFNESETAAVPPEVVSVRG